MSDIQLSFVINEFKNINELSSRSMYLFQIGNYSRYIRTSAAKMPKIRLININRVQNSLNIPASSLKDSDINKSVLKKFREQNKVSFDIKNNLQSSAKKLNNNFNHVRMDIAAEAFGKVFNLNKFLGACI